jgi:tetratricopeptide (TPR) repeat protein
MNIECKVLFFSAALLVAALLPPRAAAQDESEAPKIDLAKVYMEEGQEHYLAGRYNEAAITFMKAYSVVQLSAFLFNTAVSYEKMKFYKHAAEFFERYRADRRSKREGEKPAGTGRAPDPPARHRGRGGEMRPGGRPPLPAAPGEQRQRDEIARERQDDPGGR